MTGACYFLENSPEEGAVPGIMRFQGDPYAALSVLYPGFVGIVAEASDRPGLVGAGLINFGTCNYEEELRPYALLNTLVVHPG
jgi:hypothetical protein